MPTLSVACVASGLIVLSFTTSGSTRGPASELSVDEQRAGFEVLFDGETFDGWEQSGNWTIEDGVISRSDRGGSLTYKGQKVPDNFDLRFDWKVAEGSNSGVYYRPGQYEYQILDNAVHADGKNPRTSAASLYFCMQPSHDATRPVVEWNEGRIVCRGTVIQHWLNGEKVVHFDYTDPRWEFNVEMLRQRGADLTARGAFLNFQDHGDPVSYRNIRLRELGPEDEIDSEPVTPEELSEDVLTAEREKLEGIIRRREEQRQNES
jgi:hypothetical protein